MWTRTAVRVLTHRPVTRAWASTASTATAAAATAASPTSVQSTHDALYGQSGPSAAQENVTRPTEFPYEQPLASEQAPSSPVAAQTPTPPPPRADVHPEPAHSTLSAPRPPPRLLEPETPLPESPVSRSRRPVGAFRGGIIGFLLGLTAVGGYGYFRVLDDYRQASEKLLVSVEELKSSTEQMTTHLSRISALESNLDRLARDTAKIAEVDSLRDESRQLIESHHLDLLNLKAHVWGIEQDLRNLSKRDTAVRI